MASVDRLGLEAIRTLHSQLDDDANGNVDLSESDDVRMIISLREKCLLHNVYKMLYKCTSNFDSF